MPSKFEGYPCSKHKFNYVPNRCNECYIIVEVIKIEKDLDLLNWELAEGIGMSRSEYEDLLKQIDNEIDNERGH
jgi:hypothetical protein